MYNRIVTITNLKLLQSERKYGVSMTAQNIMMSKGVKPSALRLQIYEYLDDHRTHPTVDEIYVSLAENFPTLSKTTVYNTVKILEKSGIIKAISIEGFRTRYDANADFHGHFLCKDCGMVYDVVLKECPEFSQTGFEVSSKDVYYSGCCKSCLDNKKSKN